MTFRILLLCKGQLDHRESETLGCILRAPEPINPKKVKISEKKESENHGPETLGSIFRASGLKASTKWSKAQSHYFVISF